MTVLDSTRIDGGMVAALDVRIDPATGYKSVFSDESGFRWSGFRLLRRPGRVRARSKNEPTTAAYSRELGTAVRGYSSRGGRPIHSMSDGWSKS